MGNDPAGVGTSEVKVPSTPQTADDINDLFNEIDKETLPKEKEVKTKEVEDEDEIHAEEGDDIELHEEEEDETEKLDLKSEEDVDFEAPPKKKEIAKEYPDIFKKFPFLEKMLYRDKAYSELFGSFDDAKELAEKAETFNNFESQLLEGNTEEVLRGVKDADERAFNIIVDEYLQTLAKVDKDAYFHVVGNLNKRLIMEMVQEANNTENEDLKKAALIVQQFIFGTAKFTAPTNRVDKSKDAEQSEAEQERLSFVKERFDTVRTDLQSRVDNTLRATISDYIDPRGVMSAYVKKNAVADAMNHLSELMSADTSIAKNLDRLWRAAFDDKFSQDSLKRIQSYYLSKAKGNLRNAIMKARTEALKDTTPRSKNEEREEEETEARPQRRNIAPGRPSQPKGKNEMKKGESVTDFFMRD